MSLSSCSLVLLIANIAVSIALSSFVCFISTSRDPFDAAAEALHDYVAELRTPFIVFIPDIGVSAVSVSVIVH